MWPSCVYMSAPWRIPRPGVNEGATGPIWFGAWPC
ncbi:hypothetical protein L914_11692 [Phytophthora nicotianae]|uniref:Uncharacterized protein n=1 Tax=Phytophthora nicotianae TaxID=4792 RepID=W2N4S1_PHYNI|nr:hypothetical protein L914_11692 [Phytophthora nicotianae]